jgi:D-sedoheptulose 7-phosphate isomerase
MNPLIITTTPEAIVDDYLGGLAAALGAVSRADVARAAAILAESALDGRRVYTCGNGGSASTASHMVNDLAKQAAVQGRPRVRAHALCDSMALVTAWGNDDAFAEAFARQLEGAVEAGDVLVAISTSGRSANVLRAVEVARDAGARTIALTGPDGGALAGLVDCCIHIPSDDIGQMEDAHLAVNHALAMAVRALLA